MLRSHSQNTSVTVEGQRSLFIHVYPRLSTMPNAYKVFYKSLLNIIETNCNSYPACVKIKNLQRPRENCT